MEARCTIETLSSHQCQCCKDSSVISQAFLSGKISTETGEEFEFNKNDIRKFLWTTTRKDLIAQQQPTEVVLTTNSAMMTKNLNVVMMGLKETEAMVMMPLLGSHLLKCGNIEDEEDNGQLGLQSVSYAFH